MEEELELESSDVPMDVRDLDFVKFVENPTWKDVLLGLVNKEQLDPWNIDIVDITSKYIEVVRGMKQLDLHIPANMILAAAIMLRIKSEALVFKEEYVSQMTVEMPPELAFDVNFTNVETLPDLTFVDKFERKRKVTLNELLNAVEEAFQIEAKRGAKRTVKANIENLNINIEVEKIDVEKIIQNVYEDLLHRSDDYGLVNFNDICGETPKDKVITLLAILYLHSNNFVDVKQEEFFGDIIIRVIDKERSVAKMAIML